MKKLHQILAALILCFATAVSLSAQNRVQTMNLNMTIDDTTSAAAGVRSDLSGAYLNGTDSVMAVFQSNGYFVFNSGTRPVSFIYSTRLDVDRPLLPADIDILGVTARTFPINTTGFVPIQSMLAGTSQCLGMTWEYSPGTNLTRNVSYHYGTGDQTQTAYVTVSRDRDAVAWTIEPVNQANCGNGDVSFNNQAKVKTTTKVRNKVTNVAENGRYFMPFRLRLTTQP